MSIRNLIIGTSYAQNEELVPCRDGTLADPTVGCVETPSAIVNGQSEILGLILKAADAIVIAAVIASIIFLIYGGINYTLSAGNEDRIKKAKDILFWSVFGLVVSLLAKYIVSTVLVFITQ